MDFSLEAWELRNCSFQGCIRGFLRMKETGEKHVEHLIVDNCLFYNCGPYGANGGGYAWFTENSSASIAMNCNIFGDFQFTNNTIYDSPKAPLLTNSNVNVAYPNSVVWNIDIRNNTFANFDTRGGNNIFNLRYIPHGTTIKFRNNLFVITKDKEDVNRTLKQGGSDIRGINGSGDMDYTATFDFANNYFCHSEAESQTDDACFTSAAFSNTSNSIGKFLDDAKSMVINGKDNLIVKCAGILPTDLMNKPNPPHFASESNGDINQHHTDALDGSAGNDGVDLFYKGGITPAVLEGVGDPRWGKGKLW